MRSSAAAKMLANGNNNGNEETSSLVAIGDRTNKITLIQNSF
jgi:hypothetical protein